MCEVSTPQWPSAQISLFSKTHQSAWCGSVMIAKSPGNHDSPSDALLMSRFQNFAAAASQKTWEFERRSRGWINNSRPIILICCLFHYVCVTWLIRMCDMTHSYVWCDLRVTWLPHVCNMTHPCVWNSNVWHETESCVTFLCEVTHSYVWHHLFTRVTWLIHMWHMTICMCDMAHSHVGCMYMCDLTQSKSSFICVAWLIYMRDMTHWYVWHESFICETWLICMCDNINPWLWYPSFRCVTWPLHTWHMNI